MGSWVDTWVVGVVLVLWCSSAMGATVKHYRWEVEYKHWSPDGREGVVMAINGHFPGPTIKAQAGDTINVELVNKLFTEGVVIHWHGIRQIGTPWADGTASISQCPINPGESFVYRFKVDKAGTYFYHGHYGMQRSAGLYGSVIVDVAEGEKEPFEYEGELSILLSDWWHKSSHEQEVDLSANPMRWIGEPQTLLINGRGQYGCSITLGDGEKKCDIKGGEQYAPDILKVVPKKTYRLRIASTTALAALNFAISGHKMEVVEADGNYVDPFTVDNLDIYSGESYSILFTTNQDPTQNYWITADVRGRKPDTPPAVTLLNYVPTHQSKFPMSPPPIPPRWDDKSFAAKLLARAGSPKPPPSHTRRILLLNTQNQINGHTKWAINNVSLVLPPTPYLGAIKHGLTDAFDQEIPPEQFSSNYDVMAKPDNPNTKVGSGVYVLKSNDVVDVILQNANMLKPGVSEIHPWHLHGHDFWVLGYGDGKFTEEDEKTFNLVNPPLKNTAVIFPYGWTALRFVADNPGAWAFHCHLEPHLHMGMGVVFAEEIQRVEGIPNEALACGLTGKMLMKNAHV